MVAGCARSVFHRLCMVQYVGTHGMASSCALFGARGSGRRWCGGSLLPSTVKHRAQVAKRSRGRDMP